MGRGFPLALLCYRNLFTEEFQLFHVVLFNFLQEYVPDTGNLAKREPLYGFSEPEIGKREVTLNDQETNRKFKR